MRRMARRSQWMRTSTPRMRPTLIPMFLVLPSSKLMRDRSSASARGGAAHQPRSPFRSRNSRMRRRASSRFFREFA